MARRRRSSMSFIFIAIFGFIVVTNMMESCQFSASNPTGGSVSERSGGGSGGLGSIFGGNRPMDQDKAVGELDKLASNVGFTNNTVQRRAQVELQKKSLFDTLPPIDSYPIVTGPTLVGSSSSVVVAEIFSSSEKAGKDTDGWLVEVATDFNRQRIKTSSGKVAQIAVRKIASGTGAQFIASKKYLPHAFTPSNHLWIKMVEAHAIKTDAVRERLVGNVGGIVMRKRIARKLREQFPQLKMTDIVNAVAQGQVVTGYTNPYASSTGLNFLVSVLHAFGNTTGPDMLKPDVVSAFESFQRNVPFVAMTTLQMRDSVQNNGSLDAFVMEYQTFSQTRPALSAEYEFIPFGIRHDNPLFAIGDISTDEREALELLAKHAESPAAKRLADRYGFNSLDDYTDAYDYPDGSLLLNVQSVWKEKKDAGKSITAIFLADVSGSMRGFRINALKQALKSGADFISENNEIGLVTFSDRVNVSLPPKRFDLIQKSAFWAAVEDLQAGGNTAMYDGVMVSLSLLAKARQNNPDSKLLLFVLTDGETNRGYEFNQIARVVEGAGIPVYTIGYAQKITELKRLSSLVEAASLNANEGDVAYKIGNLLNAQM